MNNTTTTQGMAPISASAIASGLISDEVSGYLGIAFKLILNPALGAWGVSANILNMVVFAKMGLSDGVTQNFFILSISDMLISAVSLVNSFSYILQTTLFQHSKEENLRAQAAYWASYLAVTFPQNISLVTTVVIAVVRCCCVAMPLKVKHVLTAKRQLFAILFFVGIALCILAYVFSTSYIVYIDVPGTNVSIAVFEGYDFFAYTLFTNIYYYSGFATVILCVIILTISLRQSSKFREKSTGASAQGTASKTSSSTTETKPKEKKELQVVKVVFLVAVLFIISYLPAIFFAILRQYLEGFSSQGRYRNSTILFLLVNETFLLLNADLNILIYLAYNTRYREAFKRLFLAESEKSVHLDV